MQTSFIYIINKKIVRPIIYKFWRQLQMNLVDIARSFDDDFFYLDSSVEEKVL